MGQQIDRDSAETMGQTGVKTAIGTTAAQLTATGVLARRGIQLYAPSVDMHADQVPVFVGIATVTADGTAATDGMPIEAGKGYFVPVCDPSLIYVRAASGSASRLYWHAV